MRDYAVEDVVARAMESAQIDATSGELRNFDADVFLSGIAVDEKTRHLVNIESAKEKKRSNPAYGDLTEKEFLALPPEERLRRHNLANPLGTEKRPRTATPLHHNGTGSSNVPIAQEQRQQHPSAA